MPANIKGLILEFVLNTRFYMLREYGISICKYVSMYFDTALILVITNIKAETSAFYKLIVQYK